jgi:hypothetical protein
MSDLLISIRRTVVPIVVGAVTGSFLAPYVDPEALTAVVVSSPPRPTPQRLWVGGSAKGHNC